MLIIISIYLLTIAKDVKKCKIMKYYREVKVSERNPESDTWVPAYDVPEEMYMARTSYLGVWYDMHDKVTDEPQVWLESIERND